MRSLLAATSLAVFATGCLDTRLQTACAVPGHADLCVFAVTSHSPRSGPISGGTRVTLLGSGFDRDTRVELDGVALTLVSHTTDALSFLTPAHAGGAVDLHVSNSLGAVKLTDAFEFLDPPSVTGIVPSSGPRTGGYPLTLTGAHLKDAAIRIGGIAVTPATASDTAVTVTVPALEPGLHDVEVSAAETTVTLTAAFWARSWERFSEGFEEATTADLGTSPAEGGPVYLAAQGGDLYRAETAGGSWQRVLFRRNTQEHWVAISPVDADRVLSVSEEGVLLTEDGFSTARTVPTPSGPLGAPVFNATGTRVIVPALGGILISRDAGATFSLIAVEGRMAEVAAAQDDANVFAAVSDTRLFISLDAGETWNPRPLVGSGAYALSVNALRAAVANGEGLHLFPTAPSANTTTCAPPFTVVDLVSDPQNASRLWITDPFAGDVRSVDATATSCSVFSAPPAQLIGEIRDLEFASSNTLVAGTQFGAHHRSVSGVSWTEQRSGLQSPRLFALARQQTGSTRVLFAHSHRGQVHSRSGDGGWVPLGPTLGENYARAHLFAFPENTSFRLLSLSSGARTLAPGGATWVTSTGISGTPIDAQEDVLSSQLVHPVVVTTSDGVFLTTNGGVSFTNITRDLPAVQVSSPEIEGETLWVLSDDGRTFRTTLSGTSWTEGVPFTQEGFVRGLARVDGALLLSGGNTGVYRLADGATAWTSVGENFLATDLFEADPRDRRIVYANRGGSLARSADSGDTWAYVNDGSWNGLAVSDVLVDPVDGRVYLLGTSFIESLPGGP